ncbi:MAG: hypothetical protein AAFZ65_10100 [Planctomycetota bacterium]
MRQRPFQPSFELAAERPPRAVSADLRSRIDPRGPLRGRAAGDHLMLTVGERDRHLWSPWLHLELRPHREGEQRTYLRGFFTPAPGLWTAFAFAYLACGTIAFFASMWGVVQWRLDQSPWALAVGGAALAVILGLWLTSRIGRRLAAEQMRRLRDEVEAACLATPG